MSKIETIIAILCGIVLLAVGFVLFHKSPSQFGGVNAGTRTTITTIDGNTASTSPGGASNGVYINPAVAAQATSTLTTNIADVDDLTFFASFNASSSALANVGVQFWESDFPGCVTNNASTTWYALGTFTLATSTTQLPVATTFQYTPLSSSSIQGFVFKVPFTPAQCIQARVSAPTTSAAPNFQVWYGFAAQRKGYNNGN